MIKTRPILLAGCLAGCLAMASSAQNLLANPDFDDDVAGWSSGFPDQLAWSELDARNASGSGSVQTTNDSAGASFNLRMLVQCVRLTDPSTEHLFKVASFFPEDQGTTGSSTMRIEWFADQDCFPNSLGGEDHEIPDSPGEWTFVSLYRQPPAGSRSAEISFHNMKDDAGGSHVVHFDEAFFGPLPSSLEPCISGPTTLCLNAERFRVEVDWEKPDGATGQGQAVQLTTDTGYFWFFSETNVEMVIKVIRACDPGFDRFWVFAGGLTNVEAHITVTDTATGATWSRTNPQGTPFQPIQDTDAFATCP